MPNRLAGETSPYLLQHQHNPVDWYPWGEEAFRAARAQDKPVLLSVGYSACHWCHVMERESFEDQATARLMNQLFVNVKVDREERPDVDALYMTAVQQMTGHGGWPMTVFLTPDGAPFYGGTYFPPEPRHGLPAFRQVLQGIGEAYRTRREEVARSAEELRSVLEQSMALRPPPTSLTTDLLDAAYRRVAVRYDSSNGGFGSAPKFPQPMTLDFLLRHWKRTGDSAALDIVTRSLRAMARGGIYDQVGGGFHRYSVDARWLVPHFEKMLYDNALLSRVYLNAWLATGDPELRRVVEEVLDYILREMRSPEGAFYSTQDADSEGEEGKFYLWDVGEVDALLGPEEGPLFRAYYDVAPGGNFEGRSILHVDRELAAVAAEHDVTPERLAAVLRHGREVLYRARAERVWPGRDDKVITAWNAMMLRSFADAGRALGRDDYRAAAAACAGFLLETLRPGGRLLRTYKDGVAKIGAFLDDHALLVDALVSLYQADFDPRWIREARSVADDMVRGFWSEREGMFFDTAAGGETLVVRPRDIHDNATPSGVSAAAMALLRLAALTGEERYRELAVRELENLAGLLPQIPQAFGELLSALDWQLTGAREVAVVGHPHAADTADLLDVLRRHYLPNLVVALRDPDRAADAEAAVPLLRGREPVDGRAAAYVCQRFACRRPVTGPDDLLAEVE